MDSSVTSNGVKTLKSSEGYLLTQKYVDNEEERVYTNELYLSIEDNENNWIEVAVPN